MFVDFLPHFLTDVTPQKLLGGNKVKHISTVNKITDFSELKTFGII